MPLKINDNLFVSLLYDKRLPEVYRKIDKPNLQLKRYLMALTDGGFSHVIKEAEDILRLIDPDLCPAEFLPYLIESFGLEYFEDIDAKYQRRIIANIGELTRRRGTYAGVRFLVRVLTGMECDLEYYRGEVQDVYGRYLVVTLLAQTLDEIAGKDVGAYVVARYVKAFVPYYITVRVRAVIAMQYMALDIRRVNKPFVSLYYDLRSGVSEFEDLYN